MEMRTRSLLPDSVTEETQIHANKLDFSVYEILIIDEYKKIKKEPNNPNNYLELGNKLYNNQLYREAVSAYSLGISKNPFYGTLYHKRGKAYLHIDQYLESATSFEMARCVCGENSIIYRYLGFTYHLLKDFEKSINYLYDALKLLDKKEHSYITYWLFLFLLRTGKKEEAYKIIRSVNILNIEDCTNPFDMQMLIYSGKLSLEEAIRYIDNNLNWNNSRLNYIYYGSLWEDCIKNQVLPDKSLLIDCIKRENKSLISVTAKNDLKSIYKLNNIDISDIIN